ncbi:MAG TPA: ammonium transporter [Candidatus Desulfofervidus auxilii]|uniref:Ammonium transporter n=1 Tax=Desulfofervidus auxilii TaxID=1621989 RepID=A0A7V0I9N7_DESA2|nr:ammonium transporter [Candidatus Desulfofervidus auxilii]
MGRHRACHEATGLLLGNFHQFVVQIIAVTVSIIYAGLMTFIILKFIQIIIGLRIDIEDEVIGLDLTSHGEAGYKLV